MRGGGAGDINKDHLFVTTLMSEREQKRQCDEDADVCEVHFSKVCFQLSVLHESPISLTREEFCQRSSAFKAEKADTFFAAGVDDFTIQLTHEAWAPFFYSEKHEEIYHGTDKDMDGKLVSFRDDGTGRVRMVDLQEIKPSLGLILTLSELLDAAGVALDKPIGAALARSDGDGALADDSDQNTRTVRETGVVIDCHIRYYNDWSTWSPAPAVRYEIEFAPATHQNPLYSASYEAVGFGDARMMVKRNGVYVRVRHEGHLEKFSVVAMLQTITIGFMLMTLSSWILAQGMHRDFFKTMHAWCI